MKIAYNGSNCVFIEDEYGNAHCFSYTSEVAAIIRGKYTEYQGDKFYSRTSNRHKAMFREYYGVTA